MKPLFLSLLLLATGGCAFAQGTRSNRAFYLEAQHLHDVLKLSDGTLLMSGAAQDFEWARAPRSDLAISGIESSPGGAQVPFLLHLNDDASEVLRVVTLPSGSAMTLARLRTTEKPGEETGDLFISGLTQGGYFIARLDGNFVNNAPSRALWVRNVKAEDHHQEGPVWDVGSDGKVIYAAGKPYSYNWSAVYRLQSDGRDDVVEDWRTHWATDAAGQKIEGHWTPASSRHDVKVIQSAIVFKLGSRSDLRSWTQDDYDAPVSDGNGGFNKGRWPLDAFFSGPANPSDAKLSARGKGYTGYSPGRNPTQRVGDIVVDRRDNHFYIGFSIQSRLPDGLPDFEPAVIAMTQSGQMKWWNRLYPEWLDKNGDGTFDEGDPRNSPPDQYVDYMALDYSPSLVPGGTLVVGARSHGNNVINLFSGDKLAARKDAKGFKNQFTGAGGNFHLSWLGKLELDDGMLQAATYVAEMGDEMKGAGKPSSAPLLDGWPDPNAGWPVLNTTRLRALNVDEKGRVVIAAVGRRVLTTRNAFQKMPKKEEGLSSWSDFVRVYTSDLSNIEYSSLLTGAWDWKTGAGGGNIEITRAVLLENGVAVAGFHDVWKQKDIEDSVKNAQKKGGEPLSTNLIGQTKGVPLPVVGVPSWAQSSPNGQSAVAAVLQF